jgi:PmbA protein
MNPDILHDIVRAALAAGADAAEAVGAERAALSVGVRLGALEEVEREESRDLGLRVFIGKRQAVVSGSDISTPARAKLVDRAVAMARIAPDDVYAGLAPEHRLAKGPFPDLDLYDPTERDAEALEALALEAEDAARAVTGVANSDGGGASWSTSGWSFVTSHGFEGRHRASSFSVSASVIAGEGAAMERGGEGRSTRYASDLPGAAAIGKTAGERAVSHVGPRKLASTTAAVVFENRIASSIISPFVGAISGTAVARGTSFLKDKLGKPVFAPGVVLTDDPHRLRGMGSAPFDDEGVATTPQTLIEDGVLTRWLLNAAAARQLKLDTTGHASRGLAGTPGVSPHNLTVEAGGETREALMRQAGGGLLVTSMFGPSLNGNTGDWSVGVSGFWFEDGQIAYPVSGVTVAANLIELYARMIPANDLEIRGSTNSPSLFVDGLAIAGK